MKPVRVVGGGLAGSEAAWQIASAGVPVILMEMRPGVATPVHKTDGLAELVCSNSFRSDDAGANAVGVLHQEMRLAGSLIMRSADRHQLPAGSALAVDRDAFSASVGEAILAHPLIEVERAELTALPAADESLVVATGPLTSDALSAAIRTATGEDELAFFDAIAPIVHRDSIDMNVAWFQSRYDKPGPGGDAAAYLNCPLSHETYEAFIDALLAAETADFRDWEKDTPYFEGCLPIEVMASRGRQTLRYGPMKPVGLTNRHRPEEKPYAVVQLRQDNRQGTLFNMVGFQTKMKYGEQVKAFRLIPGLESAEFARLGGIHRNTFLRSPKILDERLRMKGAPHIRFAGQITGCEGYVESAAIGLIAGRFAAAEALGAPLASPPETSAHGALLAHITGRSLVDPDADFQPMNVNFGLFPEIEAPQQREDGSRMKGKERGLARKRALAARALADFAAWLEKNELRQAA
ncbi:methylenetetrahydrofolate--tRNA-(uracil(54)-C(5))-methyltransferase (FADH(2)-oxidizing) TrmFO [Afifella pfennigii]|uniref:methylenetetrahydrofolate--tRNA-(uracil(54)- C(5))-methyltransferase (FADH(2)-oxidizing) TrmFO n=1 Tax=Afifella pfennigii TaxID=209897 RepID=UPI00047D931C|nr:methylenetetrahydrofolate--tRNA-(uracil(54)-C(5))-methyltransferase (FADH(2)-oxidizing) TrmFO [Afifella pfennigii]